MHPLFSDRWSPRAFKNDKVSPEIIKTILEAGASAPSANNEQPWRFILGFEGEGETYNKLFDCLVEWNQNWVRNAPVLILSLAKRTYTKDGKENRFHFHDTGAAFAYMALQAAASGLRSHTMAGFSGTKARNLFGIPDDFEPCAMMVLGYEGAPDSLPEAFREGETRRPRRPLSESVFSVDWGNPAF